MDCFIPEKGQSCRHIHYGYGTVTGADEEYTTVWFGIHGEKSFSTNTMRTDWNAEVPLQAPSKADGFALSREAQAVLQQVRISLGREQRYEKGTEGKIEEEIPITIGAAKQQRPWKTVSGNKRRAKGELVQQAIRRREWWVAICRSPSTD